MGKGDKKTKKGKIFMGSFGNKRPAGKKKPVIQAADKPAEKPAGKSKK
ncbi:MAG: 30S ribosomal protein THX [Chitinophagaceae bacterium]|nr:30S ribosomal protein THX [Chitinophagaceae bacterium]